MAKLPICIRGSWLDIFIWFSGFFRMRNLRKDVYFHEVYVDETQDFTNAELCILMQLCSIPNRIFLTGDTAQCIMQGISFRFKDLQALLFKIKENGRDTVNVPEKVVAFWFWPIFKKYNNKN